jgi:protein-S-isoprenylcysteine O-methyltransferase Ste14
MSLGTLTPALVLGLFVVLIDFFFVRPEEEKLARTFGNAYGDYQNRVRRWI